MRLHLSQTPKASPSLRGITVVLWLLKKNWTGLKPSFIKEAICHLHYKNDVTFYNRKKEPVASLIQEWYKFTKNLSTPPDWGKMKIMKGRYTKADITNSISTTHNQSMKWSTKTLTKNHDLKKRNNNKQKACGKRGQKEKIIWGPQNLT